MPKIDILTVTAAKKGKLDLPKEIFGVEVNSALLAQSVRVYLSNQRRAKAKVKSRGEVSGSRKKIWRQKGTGRARHGDRYAPIFVGGGVAHGPTGQENYQMKLSKKMKQRALFSALTAKFKEGKISAIDGLDKLGSKTKKMAQVLEKVFGQEKKISIILPGNSESVIRAARNIDRVKLMQAKLLNAYEVLNGGKLILMPESVSVLKEVFLGQGKAKVGKK